MTSLVSLIGCLSWGAIIDALIAAHIGLCVFATTVCGARLGRISINATGVLWAPTKIIKSRRINITPKTNFDNFTPCGRNLLHSAPLLLHGACSKTCVAHLIVQRKVRVPLQTFVIFHRDLCKLDADLDLGLKRQTFFSNQCFQFKTWCCILWDITYGSFATQFCKSEYYRDKFFSHTSIF